MFFEHSVRTVSLALSYGLLFGAAAQVGAPLHDINTAGVPLYLEDGRVPDARIDRQVHLTPHLSVFDGLWPPLASCI